MVDESSQQVMDGIRRIVQALRISSRQAESAFGLSGAQLFVLQKVASADGPLSLSRLAELTLTHLSSVSVVVGRLVQQDLLTKAASSSDGRRAEIRLTAKGQKFLRSRPETAQEALIAALGQLPLAERRQLGALLNQVITAAGFGAGDSAMFFEDTPPP